MGKVLFELIVKCKKFKSYTCVLLKMCTVCAVSTKSIRYHILGTKLNLFKKDPAAG